MSGRESRLSRVKLPISVIEISGDSGHTERSEAQANAQILLTNPDLLHCSILPQHLQWSRFISGLRYVVIDEAHILRYRVCCVTYLSGVH